MRDFFDFEIAAARKKKIDEYFFQLQNNDRNVYIFGFGEYADALKKYLYMRGVSIKGFVLNEHFVGKLKGVLPLNSLIGLSNISLIYGLENGFSKWFYKKINQIQNVISTCENSDFFVPSDYWLIELGSHYFSHEFVDANYLKIHFEEFKQTYGMLSDGLSKSIMTEFLYSSVCGDASRLAQLGSNWEYDYSLELLFENCAGNIVVECGAYDGKSIAQMSDFTSGKYEMIALECDHDNYKKCCDRLSSFPNISVLKFGAWDKKTRLAIVQQASASFLKEVDCHAQFENVVDVIDIDSITASKKVAAIVMDIEGSEMKALMGAKKAIANGANLAIRVYHRKEDLITIPQYVKSLNKNYRFYLRFERGASLCRTGDETTLYAICD